MTIRTQSNIVAGPLHTYMARVAESRRLELALTEREFAKLLGMNYSHYCNCITGYKGISAAMLVALVRVGIDPRVLFQPVGRLSRVA